MTLAGICACQAIIKQFYPQVAPAQIFPIRKHFLTTKNSSPKWKQLTLFFRITGAEKRRFLRWQEIAKSVSLSAEGGHMLMGTLGYQQYLAYQHRIRRLASKPPVDCFSMRRVFKRQPITR